MPAETIDHVTPARDPGRATWLAIVTLAVAGLAVSGYLLGTGWIAGTLPAGCGGGSGCAEVLTSRWAGVFGIPVSAPAVAVYLFILGAAWARNWTWLLTAALAIAGAAIWFVALQFAVIGVLCPWCLGDHAIGLALAAVVILSARSRVPAAMAARSAGLAALGLAVLVVGQLAVEYTTTSIQRLPAGTDGDTGPGPGRELQLLDGTLALRPHDEPHLGSADADHVLVMLFDYCCPHCRATHGFLLPILDAPGSRIGVVTLPMPMDHDCNPGLDETEPRFEHACELARLALAVWRADPAAFPAYDRWLFEPEMPRDPDGARARAAELVGEPALAAALADPWIDAKIAQSIGAYDRSTARRIPVIMAVGMQAIVGRPESADALRDVLEQDLEGKE